MVVAMITVPNMNDGEAAKLAVFELRVRHLVRHPYGEREIKEIGEHGTFRFSEVDAALVTGIVQGGIAKSEYQMKQKPQNDDAEQSKYHRLVLREHTRLSRQEHYHVSETHHANHHGQRTAERQVDTIASRDGSRLLDTAAVKIDKPGDDERESRGIPPDEQCIAPFQQQHRRNSENE